MKLNKQFSILLLFSFYFFFTTYTYAFDRSAVKKVNLNAVNETTNAAIDVSNRTYQMFHNEITYFNNGTLIVPTIPYDNKSKKHLLESYGYLFVDCRAPGAIIYEKDLKSTTVVNSATVGGMVKNYFCKTKLEKNNVIWFAIHSSDNGTGSVGFNPFVLLVDSMEKNNGVVYAKYAQLDRENNKMFQIGNYGKTPKFSVNCNSNLLSAENVTKSYDDKTSHDFHYLMDTVCERNNVLKLNNIVLQTNSTNNNIKTECENLGFKKGTENYENCVLQLLDK